MKYKPWVLAVGILVISHFALKHPTTKRIIIRILETIESDKTQFKGIIGFFLISLVISLVLNDTLMCNVLAGYLYGPGKGTLLYTGVYLITTYLGYYTTPSNLEAEIRTLEKSHEEIKKLRNVKDTLDSTSQKELIFLSRLSPIVPYQLISFVWYSTQISHHTVALYSTLGTIPSTFMYSYLGSMLPSIKHIVNRKFHIKTSHIAIYLILSLILTYLSDKLAIHILNRHKSLSSPSKE